MSRISYCMVLGWWYNWPQTKYLETPSFPQKQWEIHKKMCMFPWQFCWWPFWNGDLWPLPRQNPSYFVVSSVWLDINDLSDLELLGIKMVTRLWITWFLPSPNVHIHHLYIYKWMEWPRSHAIHWPRFRRDTTLPHGLPQRWLVELAFPLDPRKSVLYTTPKVTRFTWTSEKPMEGSLGENT